MEWLLLVLGLSIISFFHLIIPIFMSSSKIYKKSYLWLLSVASGLIGFVICAMMQEEFRGLAGIIQSIFWTVVNYFILKKKCYVIIPNEEKTKNQIIFCRKCGNKLQFDARFCKKCGAEVVTPSSQNVKEDDKPFTQSNKNTISLYIGLAVLLVFIIGVAIFVVGGLDYSIKDSVDTYDAEFYLSTFIGTQNNENTEQEKNDEHETDVILDEVITSKKCMSFGCDNSINSLSSYCFEHKCAKNDCDNEKENLSSFCFAHKCFNLSCDNATDGISDYCSEHKCIEEECFFEKTYDSHYCYSHKCSSLGCQNGRNGLSFYCVDHKCTKNGCNSQKTILSDYCLLHD